MVRRHPPAAGCGSAASCCDGNADPGESAGAARGGRSAATARLRRAATVGRRGGAAGARLRHRAGRAEGPDRKPAADGQRRSAQHEARRMGRPAGEFLSVFLDRRRRVRPADGPLLLAHGRGEVRGPADAGVVGDAARHPDGGRARGDPVRHHHRDGIRCGRRRRRIPAGVPRAHPELAAHQGGSLSHRQDHGDGVLAVRRLGAVLGGVRDPRRSGPARGLGAVAQHVADAVHDPVAGDHLHSRLAAGMDRDHHHLCPDLPADAQALQHRPDPVGRAGVREPAGGVPVAAGGDVGVLSERRGAETRDAEPDLRRHDAVHADRHRLHDLHVYLAGHDAVAAELSVRELTP